MDRPNILWITTDRQRWDTLGCLGNEWVTTPHLDRLAREGVLFRQAWSQNPVCSPSRASFLTGRYPRTTRVNRNAQKIPSDERLISRLLADERYICGHAGKMHLAASCPGAAEWSEERTDDGYVVYDWSMHPPATPVSQYTAWLSEHGIDFCRTPVEGSRHIQIGMDKETSNTAWIAQRAINFIRCNKELDRPWFFTCNIEDPHEPYDPPEEFLRPYLDRLDQIPLPRSFPGEAATKTPFQEIDTAGRYGHRNNLWGGSGMSDREHRFIRAAYWAMVDHIDWQIGRIMEALRESGQDRNTLVLFHSDHGDMLGDHGIYMQGCYFYDEMVHVPLILWMPEHLRSGIATDALVELVDLAPTVLDAAGLPRYAGMQGRSLWPLATGTAPADVHREDVYFEYYQSIPNPSCYGEHGGAYATGIRNQKHALTCVHNLDCRELYDLKRDPGLMRNLWGEADSQGIQMRMLKRLCDRMAETIDPLPPAIGPY